jgi:hypothetical protein
MSRNFGNIFYVMKYLISKIENLNTLNKHTDQHENQSDQSSRENNNNNSPATLRVLFCHSFANQNSVVWWSLSNKHLLPNCANTKCETRVSQETQNIWCYLDLSKSEPVSSKVF